ncbi:hypothetical protein H4582DRAFT_2026318 [Lactarius indigo]|nr:hypothetical protein H4582DRAFT_2026318 [Lactarius indigo]
MRTSDRLPGHRANVRTSSVAFFAMSSNTDIAIVLKPSAEPFKAEASTDELLVESRRTGGPNRSRAAAIGWGAASASERRLSPGVPRPSSRREENASPISAPSPEKAIPASTHRPQGRAPAIKPATVPLSSRMHQNTRSSHTPLQGVRLPAPARPPVPQEQ